MHTHSEPTGTGLHVISDQSFLVLQIKGAIFVDGQGHRRDHHPIV
jgi:hypothetical protein